MLVDEELRILLLRLVLLLMFPLFALFGLLLMLRLGRPRADVDAAAVGGGL